MVTISTVKGEGEGSSKYRKFPKVTLRKPPILYPLCYHILIFKKYIIIFFKHPEVMN